MLLIAVVTGIMSAPMIFSAPVIARPVMATAVRTQAVAPRPAVTTPLAMTQTAVPWVFMMPNIARPVEGTVEATKTPVKPAKTPVEPPILFKFRPGPYLASTPVMLSCVNGYINPQRLYGTICPPLAPVP